MKSFSTNWKSSKNPKKQRKYVYNAPLHLKSNFVRAHLSKELRDKYQKRSATLRKGDRVKIMRGQFKGQSGNVEKVFLTRGKIFVSKIETVKKDGSKSYYPLVASNLMITELKLEDKKRKEIFESKSAEKKENSNPAKKIKQEPKK